MMGLKLKGVYIYLTIGVRYGYPVLKAEKIKGFG
jgi:hypothetical protein